MDWGPCIYIYMGKVQKEIILKTLSLGDETLDGFNFFVVLLICQNLYNNYLTDFRIKGNTRF